MTPPTRSSIERQSCTARRTSETTPASASASADRRRFVVDAVDVNLDDAFAQRRGVDAVAETDELAGGIAGDAEYRMDQEIGLEAAMVELAHHGVDEERHVVVDELDDGDVRRAAGRRPDSRRGSSPCAARVRRGSASSPRRARRAPAADSAAGLPPPRRRTGASRNRPARRVRARAASRSRARAAAARCARRRPSARMRAAPMLRQHRPSGGRRDWDRYSWMAPVSGIHPNRAGSKPGRLRSRR